MTPNKYKGETGELWKMSYKHIYQSYGFTPGSKKRHSCLKCGEWCWGNLLRYPWDIIDYIKAKYDTK